MTDANISAPSSTIRLRRPCTLPLTQISDSVSVVIRFGDGVWSSEFEQP
ncbi:MAG: hypothetical protein ABSG43_09040 [Solirubrobacteraceae bacterium]